ncbi:Adaptor protein complex AP-3 delta subunit [Microstroma glucosiphilum]|uniref:AP-3 complex subunit delta n=1 Tax=Pseudomicrostroma glucosiphilum TaxID=1684307 RepID=A0A316UDC0_9BASI|nr:Adaptor protein complex AP-3 delta subunit [Pseudomicrostroma glucosiphilum]PWN23196.1 Adaptor protein complex AP-3 delta subunit [Pseudomicrostroma glucosiphilum]
MFERTLDSLIKGLRSHRGQDEPAFVATLLEEIRHEQRSGDMEVKAGAVLKLTYLRMLGYPSSHASFPILEVMASSQYHLKQVGYLAATQSFNQDTDVLILATNLIQKDLHSANPLEVAVALNGLSHIVTPDLAQHLTGDIVGMMNHSRPAIRKKAILCIYTLIQHYPPALDQSWHRLREKLEDSDPGVVSATVNIICELARKNPVPFLALSPQLFQLLTSSSNNWVLIKIVKLFGALTPHEPRLVRKLLPPIKTLISTTPAMSLLYECIHSVISGEMLNGPGGDELAEACVEKLAAFLDDEDRNLRYIALLALVRILPTHPHLVARYQHLVLPSINDPDLSIRLRALDLAAGMASRRNLQEIVQQLVAHLEPDQAAKEVKSATASLRSALAGISRGAAEKSSLSSKATSLPSYRLEVARRILSIGASDTYANIADFEWYLSTLIRLAYIPAIPVGREVRDQIMEVTSRIKAVRHFAVKEMVRLLEDESYIVGSDKDGKELLHAAAWVCGEYAESVDNPRTVIPLLLRSSLIDCHASTLAASLHNGVKLLAHWAASLSEEWDSSRLDEVKNMTALVAEGLPAFFKSSDPEVAERASEFLQLLQFIEKDLDSHRSAAGTSTPAASKPAVTLPADNTMDSWGASSSSSPLGPAAKGPKSLHLLAPLFQPHPIGPVAEKAQSRVPFPSDLNLRAPFYSEPWVIEGKKKAPAVKEKIEDSAKAPSSTTTAASKGRSSQARNSEEEKAASAKRKAERADRLKTDPFYISEPTPSSSSKSKSKSKDKSGKKVKKSKGKEAGLDLLTSPRSQLEEEDDIDDVPIVQLSLDDLGLDSREVEGGEADALRQEVEEMPEETQTGGVERAISSSRRSAGEEGQEDSSLAGDGPSPMVVTTKKKKGKKKSRAIVE